jgi:hypothetical protein
MKSIMIQGKEKKYLYDVDTNYCPWGIDVGPSVVALIPRTGGSVARSDVEYSGYEYTHGGIAFRDAIRKAKKIKEEMEEK